MSPSSPPAVGTSIHARPAVNQRFSPRQIWATLTSSGRGVAPPIRTPGSLKSGRPTGELPGLPLFASRRPLSAGVDRFEREWYPTGMRRRSGARTMTPAELAENGRLFRAKLRHLREQERPGGPAFYVCSPPPTRVIDVTPVRPSGTPRRLRSQQAHLSAR
jgi:hypothetical protein